MVSCRHCVDAAAAAAGGIWLERYRQQPIRARACLASAHLSDTACQAAPCRSVPRSGGAAVRANVAGPRYAGAEPALDRTAQAGCMSSSPRPNPSAPSSLEKPTQKFCAAELTTLIHTDHRVGPRSAAPRRQVSCSELRSAICVDGSACTPPASPEARKATAMPMSSGWARRLNACMPKAKSPASAKV